MDIKNEHSKMTVIETVEEFRAWGVEQVKKIDQEYKTTADQFLNALKNSPVVDDEDDEDPQTKYDRMMSDKGGGHVSESAHLLEQFITDNIEDGWTLSQLIGGWNAICDNRVEEGLGETEGFRIDTDQIDGVDFDFIYCDYEGSYNQLRVEQEEDWY